jgi:hypothetical protein
MRPCRLYRVDIWHSLYYYTHVYTNITKREHSMQIMTPKQLLQECEVLTHNGRMRRMVEVGQLAATETHRPKGAVVLAPAPPLPSYRSGDRQVALGGSEKDFVADALRLWSNQSFGATGAPQSHVE